MMRMSWKEVEDVMTQTVFVSNYVSAPVYPEEVNVVKIAENPTIIKVNSFSDLANSEDEIDRQQNEDDLTSDEEIAALIDYAFVTSLNESLAIEDMDKEALLSMKWSNALSATFKS